MSNIEGSGIGKPWGTESRESEPKPFPNSIIAVDVDGVLIQPVAYRQAINKTVIFFAEKLGINPEEYTLDDENKDFGRNMSHFEANGIHDPWDVSAIIVVLMRLKKEGITVSCGDALKIYSEGPNKTAHPPETILNELKARYESKLPTETFAEITQYLTDTRDAAKNSITGIFQEYILGGKVFERTYGKKSQTGATESLIQTQDRLLINFDGLNILNQIKENGGKVVIYTGRPGLPPSDVAKKRHDGYSPEAELAIEKSNLDAFGPVTMGSMEWLARETNNSIESLTKPNPAQAVAVIIAALRGEKTNSQLLKDAYIWTKEGRIPKEIQDIVKDKDKRQKPLEIVVIEDSLSGVVAFINAKKIFDEAGLKTKIIVIGVHGGSEEKNKSFERFAQEQQIPAIMCTTMNDGIKNYLNQKQEGKI